MSYSTQDRMKRSYRAIVAWKVNDRCEWFSRSEARNFQLAPVRRLVENGLDFTCEEENATCTVVVEVWWRCQKKRVKQVQQKINKK